MATNPYRAESYLKLDVRKGVIRNPMGARMLAIPEQLIQGLHKGLEEETGSAAPVVLYSVGKWWGARYAQRHSDEVRAFHGRALHEIPLAMYVQSLRRSWGLLGWGSLELSFDLAAQGFIVADVSGAPYSASVGKLDRPSDHLVAGVLGSLISQISGRDLGCVEIACRSQGDESCTFVVGMTDRLAPASAWVKQKRPASEILDKLKGVSAS
jgi:predicted hydrocarbon binding protein